MPRRIPEQRIHDLLDAATRVFIANGYPRTQMADVASELGVAKGTLYLYVESKEALFDAVMRRAGGLLPEPDALPLPIPTPKPGALARLVREALREGIAPPALERALRRRRVPDIRVELEEILREIYAVSSENRTAIKLIDRCGGEHPELADLMYSEGRFAQLDLLTRYLGKRIRSGHLRPIPDVSAGARFLIESIAVWAVHLHWDPAPQEIDPKVCEETVVHFLLSGLLVPIH